MVFMSNYHNIIIKFSCALGHLCESFVVVFSASVMIFHRRQLTLRKSNYFLRVQIPSIFVAFFS